MGLPERYHTVAQRAEAEITEKKSRFIAVAAPVETEEAAHALIEAIRKKHYNATHTVYAYSVGLERETQRYSDDGEPSGTAGMPVLNLISGGALRNTVIAVTRYFGGTLLGTGGLVRAYSQAAREALVVARTVEKNLYAEITVAIDYTLSGKLQYETARQGHFILDTVYTDCVTYTVLVVRAEADQFLAAVTDISNGSARAAVRRTVFGTNDGGTVTIDKP